MRRGHGRTGTRVMKPSKLDSSRQRRIIMGSSFLIIIMGEPSFSGSLHKTNCPTGKMIYISIALQLEKVPSCQVQALIFERH